MRARLKITLILLTATSMLVLAASSQASNSKIRLVSDFAPVRVETTHLVTDSGFPVGGRWQSWVNSSRVPTISGPLVFELNTVPCAGDSGCSGGPPFYGPVAETWMSPKATRATLYFELGHQFDWRYLTMTDRLYLAREWKVPHAHWLDSQSSIDQGREDGLEAAFAAIYADCAMGWNDKGAAIRVGDGPNLQPMIDTCKFIKAVFNRR